MKSYRPGELFDENGRLRSELAELAPEGDRRMGANPHANGGILLRDLATTTTASPSNERPVSSKNSSAISMQNCLELNS
jgi:phosphoketolase